MEDTSVAPLTDDVIQTIKSAAKLVTGFKRRQFQAEMALKYCNGSARTAEATFGWGRDAVKTGLNEKRTGIRCQDACKLRGRKTAEERCPRLVTHVHRLIEPHAQPDPGVQTLPSFTRLSAEAVRDALRADPELAGFVPSRQTVGRLLDRLGYRLRRARKTRPDKKTAKPVPPSTTWRPTPGRQAAS